MATHRQSMISDGRLIFALIRSEPTGLGERHVTQIGTCHHCSERAWRRDLDADPGIRVARWLVRRLGLGLGRWLGSARRMGSRMASRLGTWLGMGTGMAFRLGMERTTLRRGAGILWRMCRPAVGARPMGTAQDSRQQVLVRSDRSLA
jgi:hypothetical protein